MSDDKFYIYPDLKRFATTQEQEIFFEEIQVLLELTYNFLNSNKKKDFTTAYKHLNYCLESARELSKNGECDEQLILDITHDAMLFPTYILEKCREENDLDLKLKY